MCLIHGEIIVHLLFSIENMIDLKKTITLPKKLHNDTCVRDSDIR